MASFAILAIQAVITMTYCQLKQELYLEPNQNIVSCCFVDYAHMNLGKVYYMEDKLDFQKGNSTDHATKQAADEITRLWNKINVLLEFLLTSLKLLISHFFKEIRKLRYEGK